MVPSYRLAIDVGGTFTDFVVAGPPGEERFYKSSSTPSNPADGVLDGLRTIAEDLGLGLDAFLGSVAAIVHGTTVTTNTLLTGTGAKTGLICTDGFRDVLQLRQAHREDQWNSKAAQPAMLVAREHVKTVRGRMDRGGTETVELVVDDVLSAAEAFRHDGIEAVAVALLFSFLNPAHEQSVREILSEAMPDAFVSLSSELAPQIRIYERTSTAVVNAYIGPVLQRYLIELQRQLDAHGYSGPLQIMQSNGGLASAAHVSNFSVTTLLSGPAGGPIASSQLSVPLDVPKTMTVDMGGTSFEASLARGGETEVRPGGKLGGYSLATPMLDISTIGAGGGSISSIDVGGKLRVGPASAGAMPGPACYGRGGTEATVTDANLVLGYVGTSSFGGGAFTLDTEAAHRAVSAVADQLGIDVPVAAAGIVTTINASMADSLRLMTVRRGLDAREFAIVAAGGAGPLHAAALAEDLEVPLVIVPRDASVFCAAGILVTDFKHHFVHTMFLHNLEPSEVEQTFKTLEHSAVEQLKVDGVDSRLVSFRRVAEVRYVGQVHTIDMALLENTEFGIDTMAGLKERFDPTHMQRFGHSLLESPIEIVNIRVEARGPAWEQPLSTPTTSAEPRALAPISTRDAWFGGRFVSSPVFAAADMTSGATVTGPALIELSTSTIVVPPDWSVEVDVSGPMLLHKSDVTLDSVFAKLRQGGTSV